MSKHKKATSATTFILLALVPYTRSNMLLAFKPNQFFNELENIDKHTIKNLRSAYSRAKQKGLIQHSADRISLSLRARQIVQPFISEILPSGGQLMVIFDIPEDLARVRQKFRLLLKELSFKQVQKSVWVCDQDHRQIIRDTIEDLSIKDWVLMYEAAPII